MHQSLKQWFKICVTDFFMSDRNSIEIATVKENQYHKLRDNL